MQLSGAFISNDRSQISDIILPFQHKEITHIALDVGGTLAKVVYFTKRSSSGGRLNFNKFETSKIDELIEFLKGIMQDRDNISICATGGGSHKFAETFNQRLGITLNKFDEMDCTVKGMNFLLHEIPYEVFAFDVKNEKQPIKYINFAKPKYPYLLVNIGSGVSIIKVKSETEFDRISGSSVGGATFWGLTSLFASYSNVSKFDFDDILDLTKKGQNHNVDLLVGDIYGTDYSKIGLKSTTIASSCGKIFKKLQEGKNEDLNPEDISLSLLYMISNNIGQIAYLNAKLHNIESIFFGGFFIRGHPQTMHTLSYAINFWSQGEMKALFSRHEGFLGALGAFVSMKSSNNRDSFYENFLYSQKFTEESLSSYGVLDSSTEKLVSFSLLQEEQSYHPDTYVFDDESRKFYLDTMENSICGTQKIALDLPSLSDGFFKATFPEVSLNAEELADRFGILFRDKISLLRQDPNAYGEQSLRTLLNLREQCLREVGFHDLYYFVKLKDNKLAMNRYKETINYLKRMNDYDHVSSLIHHILAGNMFDWGSSEVIELVEKGALLFDSVLDHLKISPKMDNSEKLIKTLLKNQYKKCIIFVDNSGCDVILGILPFTRFLLAKGTSCILAANTYPALNDITASELQELIDEVSKTDEIFSNAIDLGNLMVCPTGSFSPCLDLSRVSEGLSKHAEDADLVVLEGMGRAIHTNLRCKLKCDVIKIAVFKSHYVASQLGVKSKEGMVLFEEHCGI
eukprot:NODE_302_length_10333_cov_0.506840.p1 type:complete len:741 gc:universal NODE_302_length_10333_cov_0.506840:4909-7131(+)